MDWSTEVPKLPGIYWAYEDLDPEDADVLLVELTANGHCFMLGGEGGQLIPYHKQWTTADFSHWMGPLIVPAPPAIE